MSNTIYRKYRPQVFADVIGQEHVVRTIQNEIMSDSIAHAYLFSGPRGLGKTTTARLLAKSVNCANRAKRSSEPCNKCATCVDIGKGSALDVIEIDAASNRGINEIRALKEHIGFTPSGSKYRVFIIDEVHMLTAEAFNALLKTLEEPPKHAIFVLATTELHKVPDTIQSRCQTFVFRKVSNQDLKKRLLYIAKLEKVSIDDDVLSVIISRSGGFVRDAESLLGQILSLGHKKIDIDSVSALLPKSRVENIYEMLDLLSERRTKDALESVIRLVDEGVDLGFYTSELMEAVRKIILIQNEVELNDDVLSSYAEKFSHSDSVRLARLVDKTFDAIKKSDIPQLPLELMIIEYTRPDICDENNTYIYNNGNSENVSVDETAVKQSEKPERSESNKARQFEHDKIDGNIRSKETSGNAEKNNSPDSDKSKKGSVKVKAKIGNIKSKWQEVVRRSRKHNHSVALALNMVHPISIDGDTLVLGSAYDFHCERLSSVENRNLVDMVLEEVFGERIICNVVRITEEEARSLDPGKETMPKEQEEKLINDVLEVFGGSVVS